MKQYDAFETQMVYDFGLGDGGIGDCMKYFVFVLDLCMKSNTRLYYKRNNIEIEKFVRLNHSKMYIQHVAGMECVKPNKYYYADSNHDILNAVPIPIKDVFHFTEEVFHNCHRLFPMGAIHPYISIHVRLGDQFLETDRSYVQVTTDVRPFCEEDLFKFIEKNIDQRLFFCCDNTSYKLKLKDKYPHLLVTQCEVGHSGLTNTTTNQVLDTVTELNLLAFSEFIYAPTFSGFSYVAAKYMNIPLFLH